MKEDLEAAKIEQDTAMAKNKDKIKEERQRHRAELARLEEMFETAEKQAKEEERKLTEKNLRRRTRVPDKWGS